MALRKFLIPVLGIPWLLLGTGCLLSRDADDGGTLSAKTAPHEGNRRKWERQGIGDYSFRLFQGCLCVPQGWFQVEVEDGKAVRLDSIPGKEGSMQPVETGSVPTVDTLFAILGRASKDSNFSVEAEYDPVRGYPRRIRIEYIGSPHLYDAGYHIEVEGFEAR
jgi:hypothetical protein